VALTRRGNQAAFEALVARYQARLLAFCRHMLSTREDAEDVLQEVFAAAFNAMLADTRPINVRPWLYRIARNRSLNHLRRQQAIGVDSMDIHVADHGTTTAEKAHKREEFRLLMADVQTLPETQRTALLLREIDALSYEQIAEAMDTTIPSVKSLLVRARVSLAEANEARAMSCEEVREELGEVAEGIRQRASAPVRRHVRTCERCSGFRKQLRATNKALAAVFPVGPLLFFKKALLAQLGTTASAAGGSAAAGAGAAAATAGTGSVISAGVTAVAGKAAAGFAAAALVTAGAVEVKHSATRHRPQPVAVAAAPAVRPVPAVAAQPAAEPTVVATHKQPTSSRLEKAAGGTQAPASRTAEAVRDKIVAAATAPVAGAVAAAGGVPAAPEQQFDTTTLPAQVASPAGGTPAPDEPAPAAGQPVAGQPQPTTTGAQPAPLPAPVQPAPVQTTPATPPADQQPSPPPAEQPAPAEPQVPVVEVPPVTGGGTTTTPGTTTVPDAAAPATTTPETD